MVRGRDAFPPSSQSSRSRGGFPRGADSERSPRWSWRKGPAEGHGANERPQKREAWSQRAGGKTSNIKLCPEPTETGEGPGGLLLLPPSFLAGLPAPSARCSFAYSLASAGPGSRRGTVTLPPWYASYGPGATQLSVTVGDTACVSERGRGRLHVASSDTTDSVFSIPTARGREERQESLRPWCQLFPGLCVPGAILSTSHVFGR